MYSLAEKQLNNAKDRGQVRVEYKTKQKKASVEYKNQTKKECATNTLLSIYKAKIRRRRTLVQVNPASRKVGAASERVRLSVAITDLA